MTRQDTATRQVTTGIVAAVALFAGVTSWTHIYSLARDHGQPVLSAALLPLSVDGMIAAASAVVLIAARTGAVPKRARFLLVLGVGATIAANIAYGLPHGRTGALLSVWPAVAFISCTELLAWMREHLQVQPTVKVASPDASKPKPDAPQTPQPDAPDLITAAEAKFPEACSGGPVPSLRVIQGEMKIGQGKAQAVQRHFLALQAAA